MMNERERLYELRHFDGGVYATRCSQIYYDRAHTLSSYIVIFYAMQDAKWVHLVREDYYTDSLNDAFNAAQAYIVSGAEAFYEIKECAGDQDT